MAPRSVAVALLVVLAGCSIGPATPTDPQRTDRPTVTEPDDPTDGTLTADNVYDAPLTVRLLVVRPNASLSAVHENGSVRSFDPDLPAPGRFLYAHPDGQPVDLRAADADASARATVPANGVHRFEGALTGAPSNATVVALVGGAGAGYSLYAVRCRDGRAPVSGTVNASKGAASLDCRERSEPDAAYPVDVTVRSWQAADGRVGVYLLSDRPRSLQLTFANGSERRVPFHALPIAGNVTRARPVDGVLDGARTTVPGEGRRDFELRTRALQPHVLVLGVSPGPEEQVRLTGGVRQCRAGLYTAGVSAAASEHGTRPAGLVCSAGTPQGDKA